ASPQRPSSPRSSRAVRTAAAVCRSTAMSSSSSIAVDSTFPAVPIRAATQADVGEIHALINELAEYERLAHEAVATVDDLRRHLFGADPAASVLIAETDDGEVAGFALYFTTFSTFRGDAGI